MARTLRIIGITDSTMADGPGLRNTIWAAGCAHHCKGCHNPQTWDFKAGYEIDIEQLAEEAGGEPFIDVTFSGGDPVYQAEGFAELARLLKQKGKNIWLYTGFLLEDIYKQPGGKELLQWVDVVVDGPYQQDRKETQQAFRGSTNQRFLYRGVDF